MGESSTLHAAEPAAAVTGPPAASPHLDVPQPANRSQSERYAFFVAAAVEACTASNTRANASAGNSRS